GAPAMIFKILLIIISLTFTYTQKANAADFKQIDYLKMLINHPFYNNYDPETGRFKNTKSEIIPIEQLYEKEKHIINRITELENEKAMMVKNSLIFSIDKSQNNTWEKIANIDLEISQLTSQLNDLNDVLENGGIPYESEIFKVISQITSEIKREYSKDVSSNTVILNKLPLYRKGSTAPNIDNFNSGYFDFLKMNNECSLNNYIKFESTIGLLFKSSAESVIYSKGEYEK
ncbi:MAG: hypothetical protein PHF08_12705, partial [Candidatus Riflebacteria bacterium]|nr:hypothetical protein [Candidatus Riflebacteria bacterium]